MTCFSKEEYEKAKENGIGKKTLWSRVYISGWDLERALTTKPKVNTHIDIALKEKLKKNNITYNSYSGRIRRGMSEEEASTIPMMTISEIGRKGGYAKAKKYEYKTKKRK